MDIEAMMAQYGSGQMSEEQKRAAISQALAAAGFGILGSNTGGGWQGAARALGRGGLLGMGSYNQSKQDAAAAPMQNLDMIGKMMALKGQQQSMEDEQAYRGAAQGYQPQQMPQMPSMAPTNANAATLAAQPRKSPYEEALAFVDYLKSKGVPQKYIDAQIARADKLRPEFDTTPRYGTDEGNNRYTFILDKQGNEKRLNARPDLEKIHFQSGGGQVHGLDPFTGAPRMNPIDVTMDPAQRDASARGWAGLNQQKAEFGYRQSADKTMTSQKAGELVSGLRKEFNALQPVQNYRAALPVVESAKNAPDTPAGDLDLIYAVGKALDPNSVVREGELNLVIKSGSPMQRFAGYAQYIGAGRGRLPAAQRAELIQMLNGRVGQLKAAHDTAAAPYIKQAQAQGLPMDQIFQEEKKSATPIRSGGPAVGAVVDGHRFKGGDPNKAENWERAK